MQRMEIHFIIDCHGNIQSVVKGVKGNGCKVLIEEVKKLGHTDKESPTGELFEKEQGAIVAAKLGRP
jgi:hypothetical protein